MTDPETRLLRAGAMAGALTPPIEPASTFPARDLADFTARATDHGERRFYTRYGNPTHAAAEAVVADLEGAEAARLAASGMGAIATTLLTLCAPGERIVAQRTHYGGTHALLERVLRHFGVEVVLVDQTDTAALLAAIRGEERGAAGAAGGAVGRRAAAVVYLETPSNPLLEITDLRAVCAAAREAGAVSVVDNTLATPLNQRPLSLGADLVVHSATKYLGGHSDLTAGVVAGPAALVGRVRETSLLLGATLGAFDAWLLQRGVRTLAVRVARVNTSTQAVAEFLAGHPAVAAVHYPGLASHPQHALAAAQMPGGAGGLLSFELADSRPEALTAFVESLALFDLAASLGGVHSLVVPPAAMLAGVRSAEELDAGGVPPGLVRLAIGLEHPDDLVADLAAAL